MAPARDGAGAIAARLGSSVEEVADGAIRIAIAMMTAEASNVLARRGVDAPHFRMVAFGGAGPLLGALLAEELSIDTILIPPHPGALSALGAARADLEGDLVQPVYAIAARSAAGAARGTADGAGGAPPRNGSRHRPRAFRLQGVRTEMAAEMRYDGQGYDVTVPLDRAWLADGDTRTHRVGISCRASGDLRACERQAQDLAEGTARACGGRNAEAAGCVRCRTRHGTCASGPARPVRLLGQTSCGRGASIARRIGQDETIAGPAIINQMDTTTLVPPGWQARRIAAGAMVLERAAEGRSRMMDATVRRTRSASRSSPTCSRPIVDEMAWIVLRSSHTTFVKETQDFAVSLVTNEGEIFAYPYGSGATPIMGVPMHAGTRAFDDWRPGDVMMTNDPYTTGGMVMHLNDIYLFKPMFVEGRLLCFAWTFIHCTDVGGYAPGSIDMRNNEVFQEGLRLRPVEADARRRAEPGTVEHLRRQLPHSRR